MASKGKAIKLIAAFYSRENPFFAEIAKGMQYESKKLGVSLTVVYANTDPSEQLSDIETAVSQKPSGIIVDPINGSSVTPGIEKAKKTGIPVVTIADNIDRSGWKYQLAYVGSNYQESGLLKAKYIAEQLHGTGDIGVIHVIRGLDFTEEQWKGAKQVFSKYPGIKIAAEIYAGSSATSAGLTAAENMLTAHSDLAAIYVDNDSLAIGALRAAEERGLKKLVLVGGNGTAEGVAAVKAGTIGMTVSYCGFSQGQLGIESLFEYIKKGIKPTKHAPQIAITKSNVAQFAGVKPGCDAP